MKASLKISQLESKISDLQFQKQRLLEEREKEIALIISNLDLSSLDDKVLVEGLQFLKYKVSTKDPLVEEWRSAGERFLRQKKNLKSQQAFKGDAYPQPTPQQTQKSPQSREQKNETQKTS